MMDGLARRSHIHSPIILAGADRRIDQAVEGYRFEFDLVPVVTGNGERRPKFPTFGELQICLEYEVLRRMARGIENVLVPAYNHQLVGRRTASRKSGGRSEERRVGKEYR